MVLNNVLISDWLTHVFYSYRGCVCVSETLCDTMVFSVCVRGCECVTERVTVCHSLTHWVTTTQLLQMLVGNFNLAMLPAQKPNNTTKPNNTPDKPYIETDRHRQAGRHEHVVIPYTEYYTHKCTISNLILICLDAKEHCTAFLPLYKNLMHCMTDMNWTYHT